MINLATFRARHPEFEAVPDSVVQAGLDSSQRQTDAEVFSTDTDDAHRTLAAHILAMTPNAREARLDQSKAGGDGTTVYLVERRRLEALHCTHWVVP